MIKWEYCTFVNVAKYDQVQRKIYFVPELLYRGSGRVSLMPDADSPMAQIAHLGLQGWELVTVMALPKSMPGKTDTNEMVFYFKRPLP